MKDLNMEQLTDQYFDVLKELGNIGAGNATTALAQMIDCKVDMCVPQVRLLEFKEVVVSASRPQSKVETDYLSECAADPEDLGEGRSIEAGDRTRSAA